jgi:hypothetical protein
MAVSLFGRKVSKLCILHIKLLTILIVKAREINRVEEAHEENNCHLRFLQMRWRGVVVQRSYYPV